MTEQHEPETLLRKRGGAIFAVVVLAAAGIYLAVHFSSSGIEAQMGTWTETNGSELMVFFQDGAFYTVVDGRQMAGDYTFPSNETIRLDDGGMGSAVGPIAVPKSISGDVLTIGPHDGSSRYNREI